MTAVRSSQTRRSISSATADIPQSSSAQTAPTTIPTGVMAISRPTGTRNSSVGLGSLFSGLI
ncbi:hypothetical protein [Gordonia sp. SID5947]|uniref:hypothetical protein n=1 Tax=Gordonia sp. SID5947 TaxID=2690315 RepID=UPI001F2E2AE8|nr:hypothetical protein [Gordonia sp. SID5947]